jgi:very-short-patch-repair endonuclease
MLQAHGYTVARFTWRQVKHETLLVTVRIAQLLARTGEIDALSSRRRRSARRS